MDKKVPSSDNVSSGDLPKPSSVGNGLESEYLSHLAKKQTYPVTENSQVAITPQNITQQREELLTEADQNGYTSDKKISTERSPNRPNPQKYRTDILMPDSLEDNSQYGSAEPPLVTEVNREVPTMDK